MPKNIGRCRSRDHGERHDNKKKQKAFVEVFRVQTVWQGHVEVFDLHNHPKAKRCYGWSHIHGAKDDQEPFVAVLEIPAVDSALKAVQVQLVKDIKGKK